MKYHYFLTLKVSHDDGSVSFSHAKYTSKEKLDWNTIDIASEELKNSCGINNISNLAIIGRVLYHVSTR